MLYMLEIRIEKKHMMALTYFLGLYFSRFEFEKFLSVSNVDFASYIQQVGHFWRGELDYT